VANLVALPLPVWAGALADRFGPRPLVVGAEAAMALGFLAYAGVTGPVGILAAAMLVAAGVRVFWCTIFTLVADYADGRPGGTGGSVGVDTWYAISNAARTAGLALGGLATGLVVADGSAAGYRAVAYGAAVFLALAAVLVALGVRARTGSPRPLARSATANC
jgi:MFS family permease